MAEQVQHSLLGGQVSMPSTTRLELADVNPILYSDTSRWMRKHGKAMKPKLTEQQTRELHECFTLMDLDGSGSIDASELKEAFTLLGLGMSTKQTEAVLQQVDADGTGEVEWGEFLQIMTHTLKSLAGRQAKKGKVQLPFALMSTAYRRKRYLESVLCSDKEAVGQLAALAVSGERPWQPQQLDSAAHGAAGAAHLNLNGGAGKGQGAHLASASQAADPSHAAAGSQPVDAAASTPATAHPQGAQPPMPPQQQPGSLQQLGEDAAPAEGHGVSSACASPRGAHSQLQGPQGLRSALQLQHLVLDGALLQDLSAAQQQLVAQVAAQRITRSRQPVGDRRWCGSATPRLLSAVHAAACLRTACAACSPTAPSSPRSAGIDVTATSISTVHGGQASLADSAQTSSSLPQSPCASPRPASYQHMGVGESHPGSTSPRPPCCATPHHQYVLTPRTPRGQHPNNHSLASPLRKSHSCSLTTPRNRPAYTPAAQQLRSGSSRQGLYSQGCSVSPRGAARRGIAEGRCDHSTGSRCLTPRTIVPQAPRPSSTTPDNTPASFSAAGASLACADGSAANTGSPAAASGSPAAGRPAQQDQDSSGAAGSSNTGQDSAHFALSVRRPAGAVLLSGSPKGTFRAAIESCGSDRPQTAPSAMRVTDVSASSPRICPHGGVHTPRALSHGMPVHSLGGALAPCKSTMSASASQAVLSAAPGTAAAVSSRLASVLTPRSHRASFAESPYHQAITATHRAAGTAPYLTCTSSLVPHTARPNSARASAREREAKEAHFMQQLRDQQQQQQQQQQQCAGMEMAEPAGADMAVLKGGTTALAGCEAHQAASCHEEQQAQTGAVEPQGEGSASASPSSQPVNQAQQPVSQLNQPVRQAPTGPAVVMPKLRLDQLQQPAQHTQHAQHAQHAPQAQTAQGHAQPAAYQHGGESQQQDAASVAPGSAAALARGPGQPGHAPAAVFAYTPAGYEHAGYAAYMRDAKVHAQAAIHAYQQHVQSISSPRPAQQESSSVALQQISTLSSGKQAGSRSHPTSSGPSVVQQSGPLWELHGVNKYHSGLGGSVEGHPAATSEPASSAATAAAPAAPETAAATAAVPLHSSMTIHPGGSFSSALSLHSGLNTARHSELLRTHHISRDQHPLHQQQHELQHKQQQQGAAGVFGLLDAGVAERVDSGSYLSPRSSLYVPKSGASVGRMQQVLLADQQLQEAARQTAVGQALLSQAAQ